MVTFSSIRNAKATAKPKNQPIGVRLVRTTALMVLVTESNVWPGAMTGGVRSMPASRPRVLDVFLGGHQRRSSPSAPAAVGGSSVVLGFRTMAR